jgi:hypothetical protein
MVSLEPVLSPEPARPARPACNALRKSGRLSSRGGRKRRRKTIEAGDLILQVSQGANKRLTETNGASCNQDSHTHEDSSPPGRSESRSSLTKERSAVNSQSAKVPVGYDCYSGKAKGVMNRSCGPITASSLQHRDPDSAGPRWPARIRPAPLGSRRRRSSGRALRCSGHTCR